MNVLINDRLSANFVIHITKVKKIPFQVKVFGTLLEFYCFKGPHGKLLILENVVGRMLGLPQ
jgi:hypothetical protein